MRIQIVLLSVFLLGPCLSYGAEKNNEKKIKTMDVYDMRTGQKVGETTSYFLRGDEFSGKKSASEDKGSSAAHVSKGSAATASGSGPVAIDGTDIRLRK